MMEDILQCFDFRNAPPDSLVIEKLFTNIEVKHSDAAFSVRFSDADVKYNVRRGVPLAWFWCDSIIEIVENHYGKNKSSDSRDNIKCVLNFVRDEDNLQHLKKVRSARSKAEILAILSHHLFVPLSPSGEYVIDGNHSGPTDINKCPACNTDLNLGNTSIGNNKVWHGSSDIIIDRTTVKVVIDNSEEDEDYECEEPVSKRLKVMEDIGQHDEIVAGGKGSDLIHDVYTSCIEMKKDKGFVSNLQEIFAQTITNAFYQSKKNTKLKDLCVPSFLISNDEVKIIMYNCEQDRLYMSVDMGLWNEDGSLNFATVICIWLALNFENFQNQVKDEDLEAVSLKNSTFQAKLPGDILTIYQNDLRMCLPLLKKKEDPLPLTAFGLPSSRYAQDVVDKLKRMANSYFT